MGKRGKILRLREKIMSDIQGVNILLDLIDADKIETLAGIRVLVNIALERGKRIDKNNKKIGRILRG